MFFRTLVTKNIVPERVYFYVYSLLLLNCFRTYDFNDNALNISSIMMVILRFMGINKYFLYFFITFLNKYIRDNEIFFIKNVKYFYVFNLIFLISKILKNKSISIKND